MDTYGDKIWTYFEFIYIAITHVGIPLAYNARLGLWMRDREYFEDEVKFSTL